MLSHVFTVISTRIATAVGRPAAFVGVLALIVVWAATGPLFDYSDGWQLVVNTATSVITFLMVFLIQNSQNRDAAAMQAKLDELIRANAQARPEFIGIEHLTDAQICRIRDALEREVAGRTDRHATADDSVDKLLERR